VVRTVRLRSLRRTKPAASVLDLVFVACCGLPSRYKCRAFGGIFAALELPTVDCGLPTALSLSLSLRLIFFVSLHSRRLERTMLTLFATLGRCTVSSSILLALILSSFWAAAQEGQSIPEMLTVGGAPAIRNYSPDEYKAHNQIWAIVQDARGVMYFANSEGISEYDGVSWRLIPLAANTIGRSLAINDEGRIFAGCYGEFGYLAPDTNQQLQYVSLLPHVEEKYRNFTDVWQTISVGDYIYFVTQKYIFRWDGKKMDRYTAKFSFHVGFDVNDHFYVRQHKVGLMHIITDSLVMAPAGELLATERVMSMLPFPSGGPNQILMATRSNGLLVYDGQSIKPFITEADPILKEGQLYCGAALADGHYAFGTIQSGGVIIDAQGKIQQSLNKSTGLPDETIWYLYPDRQNGLWIGMHLGISRVEVSAPFTHFGEKQGLEGSALEIIRHNQYLYAATSMGIFYLDESVGGISRPGYFKKVSDVSPQAWALLPFDDVLLGGCFDGVYEIIGGKGRLINATYAMSLARSKKDPNRVFVGLQKGMKSLYFTNGKWVDEGLVEGIETEIINIYETPEGKLWLTARFNGMELVDYSNGFSTQPQVMRYDTSQGLIDLERTIPFNSVRGLRFATSKGVQIFNEVQQRFQQDSALLTGMPGERTDIFYVGEDRWRNLWMVTQGELGVGVRQVDSTYIWKRDPFLRIEEWDDYCAYPDPLQRNITWIGCIDRVIRYNEAIPLKTDQDFPTLIRDVFIQGDSLVYGGAGLLPEHMLTLRSNYKSIRVNYAAPTFDDASKNMYQYMLEGYDSEWSDWTGETYRDFTGLSHGTYRFMVRSKNIYQHTGSTAVLEFKILPPFYLSWWAWIFYILIGGAFVLVVWKTELARLRKKHQAELEQVEFEKLKELDQLKSRFFANITHEFRTPLTLILGPVNDLLSTKPEGDQLSKYQMIRNNAQRLLRLINQLLDLSKLEAGKMKLALSHEDIIPVIKSMVHSFESMAITKRTQLVLKSDVQQAIIDFDRDKIEQVLTNLIANALKFTPDGGKVTVSIKADQLKKEIEINVADTGPGISADQLPHIFERFYQGKEAASIGETGSGIGLALARELVELHKGHISAHSVEHQGTTFSIVLPYKGDVNILEAKSTIELSSLSLADDASPVQPLTKAIEEKELDSDTTVLLVEDNPDMRAFIRETLAGSYRVIEAADGQDGVEKAFEYIPDLICSDVMMPRMDGLELCTMLKRDERTSHIPIILLTSKADIESRLAGLERGADEYLAKPFNKEELLLRARNLLDIRQHLRQRYSSLQPIEVAETIDVQIEDAFLQKIRVIVEEHLADADFEVDKLARLTGMSRSQLFRKVKALTGQSPSIFIRSIRLHRGKELLETTQMNVSEVAYHVGFSTPTYFSDAFNEYYGIRPSQFRK